MQLEIPAGAIPDGETVDVTDTLFDQVEYLPSGGLPEGTWETYAFNYRDYQPLANELAPITQSCQNRGRGTLMALNIAIINLPNVGKSTTFNALVLAQHAAAENYPFCTIAPNRAIVPIVDGRVDAHNHLHHQRIRRHRRPFSQRQPRRPGSKEPQGAVLFHPHHAKRSLTNFSLP
jgi:hypothetical protein